MEIAPLGKKKYLDHVLKHRAFYSGFFLLILMVIMLYYRIAPFYDLIFTKWFGTYGTYVNFAADDAVYHMRLVHNTAYHFPWRIFFDPFTHFPFGDKIHFGPLFTLLLLTPAWVIGFGNPSHELINQVAAYVPPILGAICIIPTYFIGKKLFGRSVGLWAAFFLAFLPGEFFTRSALGYADHHVAEVLFSTLTLLFLVYAFDFRDLWVRESPGKERQLYKKKTITYAALAGFTLGLYLLIWPAAILVAAILFIFFIIQSIVDWFKGYKADHLLLISILTFVFPIVMILPYALCNNPHLELAIYSLTQPIILTAMLVSLIIICFVSNHLRRKGVNKALYPLILTLVLVFFVIVTSIIEPTLYKLMIGGIKLLFDPGSGMLTVGEVWPSIIDKTTHSLTLSFLLHCFCLSIIIAFVALIMVFSRVYKNGRTSENLFLVWTLLMMLAMFAQLRFSYYFAVNVALLCGYFSIVGSNFLAQKNSYHKLKSDFLKRNLSYISSYVLLVLIAIYPMVLGSSSLRLCGALVSYEWYDALMWLKNHTPKEDAVNPNGDFNYDSGFYHVPKTLDHKYVYPSSAYGVMSWWDYGHIITYIAERIPNANPFQHGVLENNNTAGAAVFFTTSDEEAAFNNLNSVGSRYIVIDFDMATGKYYAMKIWANNNEDWTDTYSVNIRKPEINPFGFLNSEPAKEVSYNLQVPIDSTKFHNSMMNRLYYEDCYGMQHFRLIYESEGDYFVNAKIVDLKNGKVIPFATMHFDNYLTALNVAKQSDMLGHYQHLNLDANNTVFSYDPKPPVKYVKVFEKVPGAKIIGYAPTGTKVEISLLLQMKNDRIFPYKQSTVAQNGKYTLIVPYPTEPMKGNDYSYDVFATGKYTLTIGKTKKLLAVPESAVMNGATIKL